jgi:hypothetical protein
MNNTQIINVGVIATAAQGMVLRFPFGFYSWNQVLKRWPSAKYQAPFFDMDGDQLMQAVIPWEVAGAENIAVDKPYQWDISKEQT